MPFRYLLADNGVHLWRKELVGGDVALAVVNYNDATTVQAEVAINFNLLEAGFSLDTRVQVVDIFESAVRPRLAHVHVHHQKDHQRARRHAFAALILAAVHVRRAVKGITQRCNTYIYLRSTSTLVYTKV